MVKLGFLPSLATAPRSCTKSRHEIASGTEELSWVMFSIVHRSVIRVLARAQGGDSGLCRLRGRPHARMLTTGGKQNIPCSTSESAHSVRGRLKYKAESVGDQSSKENSSKSPRRNRNLSCQRDPRQIKEHVYLTRAIEDTAAKISRGRRPSPTRLKIKADTTHSHLTFPSLCSRAYPTSHR